MENFMPASIFARFLAFVIDAVILSTIGSYILYYIRFKISVLENGHLHVDTDLQRILGSLIVLIMAILYFAIMESSTNQGTIGKMITKCKVTDIGGNKITFMKALKRNILRIITNLFLCIGYLWSFFNKKRQTLYDYYADTIVINKYK